jgi:hypothetical protein
MQLQYLGTTKSHLVTNEQRVKHQTYCATDSIDNKSFLHTSRQHM